VLKNIYPDVRNMTLNDVNKNIKSFCLIHQIK